MAEDIPFITQVPVIEVRKTAVVIRAKSGSGAVESAMPVATFAKFLDRGQRALKEHAEGDRSVIIDD